MITAEQRELVFEPLGEGAWRLCDSTIEENNAARVVAYVERMADGGFEAIWIGMGVASTWHPSREDVLVRARSLRASVARSTRSKPIPIPHRAPVGAVTAPDDAALC